MTTLALNFKKIDLSTFLRDFWQQKPLLLRGAFANFNDVISPDELAGLALDAAVESRLICKRNGQWQAQTGPFENYDELGERDWTLVVQAAEHWCPAVAELTQAFDFLPDWRRDDVMISFATEGGSVGPHIDNYDTFICQGSGSRHWRVGDKGEHQQFSAHEALLHVKPFAAIIDVQLQAGDILYIPPGYPHEGISLCPSMSFSVGFRTQSVKDTLSALADFLIDHDLANSLLTDPARARCTHSGLIDQSDFNRIKQHLQLILQDEQLLARFAGHHLSEPRHTLDALEEPLDYSEQDVLEILQQQPLIRLGGLRCYYLAASIEQGLFYINGDEYQLDVALVDCIKQLCDHQTLTAQHLARGLTDTAFMQLLTDWVNQGCWYFEPLLQEG